MKTSRWIRGLVMLTCLALSGAASAANLLTETFTGTTAPGWTIGGVAALTAPGTDPAGSGWLRLTPNINNSAGYALYTTAIAASNGIQVAFDFNDWGGVAPADGIVVAIIDGGASPTLPGGSGGSIGYAQNTAPTASPHNGIVGGMLGIALDEYGNFSNPTEGRQGGPGLVSYSVTIRGPGNGTSSALITTPGGTPNYPNYGFVANSGGLSSSVLVPQPSAVTRPTGADVRRAVVNFDMSDIANSNAYVGVKIYDGNNTLLATPVANANVGASLIQYFGAGNVPTTFKLSLTSGTGSWKNYHEVKNLTVDPAAPGGSFGQVNSSVTTGITPGGSGNSAGDGTYPPGTNIVISAGPSNGWLFVHWNDGDTNSSRTITVPASNITYTATFGPAATITVNVNRPAGGSATGGGTFLVGSNDVLTVTTSNLWRFLYWSDGTRASPYGITVPSTNTTYTANVAPDPRLFFQHPNGDVVNWLIDSNGTFVSAAFMGNVGDWVLETAGDINGDGISDLLFDDPNGDQGIWFLNADGSVNSMRQIFPNNISDPSWKIAAAGDWDGIGHDQVFWQNPAGDVVYWVLDVTGNFQSATYLANTTTWKLRGAGRLFINGDPQVELLWQNGGQVASWYRVGSSIFATLLPYTVTPWLLSGVVDIDGDGVSDLVWQNPTGDIAGWFMNPTNGTFNTARILGSTGPWKLKAGGT
ncbi:MAG: hypothetical protein NTY53_25055 [Kiritimatiellaeota bacterium]|nr:hypothetical protein [Kiritimatiellota bacterium]